MNLVSRGLAKFLRFGLSLLDICARSISMSLDYKHHWWYRMASAHWCLKRRNGSSKELSAAVSSVRVFFFMHTPPFLPFRVAPFDTKSYHVDFAWLTTARRRVSFITFPKTAAVLSTPLNQRLLQLHNSGMQKAGCVLNISFDVRQLRIR